jgi:hypothetical protein
MNVDLFIGGKRVPVRALSFEPSDVKVEQPKTTKLAPIEMTIELKFSEQGARDLRDWMDLLETERSFDEWIRREGAA